MSLLITVEGLDGVGKSTLVEALVEELPKHQEFYPWIYASKEPGSPWSGKVPADIRKMVLETPDFKPIERELLFYVDASLHSRFIQSQRNAIIISDRGLWSHLAYLRGYLKDRQLDHEDYELCKKVIAKTCHEPDCIVYLKGSLDLMRERLSGKKKDAIESGSDNYFAAVLDTYEDLVQEREWQGKPIVTLSASDSTVNNVKIVIDYLKGVFHEAQLKEGDRGLCFY